MKTPINRRRFLGKAACTGAALAIPSFIPARALGRGGAVAPSERIVVGAIGIGGRGNVVLDCFLQEKDAQFVAICDVKATRRDHVKRVVDTKYGNQDCERYRDLRDLLAREDLDAVLIATGPNWHTLASILSAQAGKDVYCEKPCSKTIAESLALRDAFRRTGRIFQGGMQRRSLPNFGFAAELARTGGLGSLTTLVAHPGGLATGASGWDSAEQEPDRETADWDLYLGPAAWRPYNSKTMARGGSFEKGGGFTGGGCLEWGSHCVDLCQWANRADDTAPVEYWPEKGQLHARYANGVKLICRNEGWLPLGTCPVRFEGTGGWVETADNGDLVTSSPTLLGGKRPKITGYPANFHVRNFLDCVKSRAQTRVNAEVACQTHITCNAGNIALYLNRKVTYDPVANVFIGDDEANRLRSESLREPWRI